MYVLRITQVPTWYSITRLYISLSRAARQVTCRCHLPPFEFPAIQSAFLRFPARNAGAWQEQGRRGWTDVQILWESTLLLVASLLLVVWPGAPSSVLAPSSNSSMARSP